MWMRVVLLPVSCKGMHACHRAGAEGPPPKLARGVAPSAPHNRNLLGRGLCPGTRSRPQQVSGPWRTTPPFGGGWGVHRRDRPLRRWNHHRGRARGGCTAPCVGSHAARAADRDNLEQGVTIFHVYKCCGIMHHDDKPWWTCDMQKAQGAEARTCDKR